ncbi:hypothetical protein [Vibrio fluvialis]|uniref:hypothetical protein n=2 Tax=Vibrio fluvialis TaxID=676 RepID=UPI00301DFEA4
MKLRDSCFLLLLVSCISFANDDLKDSYDNLNQRHSVCLKYKHRIIDINNNSWLKTLDDEHLKVALLELNNIAIDRCVESETKEYTYELFMQSLKDGKIDRLKAWFDFNNRNYPEEYTSVRDSLSERKMEELSNTEDFKLPFNVLETYEASIKERLLNYVASEPLNTK